ncbi:putative necrosis-inducing factor-domain-containing protein [Podospora aff. communis PSN243]|uniref:Necrosis-inducing factor-domain-containing protein n=1 Tax=Podospora aff. communis PSN243 TaxID=3040156 RepID=A0AAV9GFS2_9PEZI|nr:putative necrosis-inducing factor-domain-containing protein [Podospora aff. communis PSN243]
MQFFATHLLLAIASLISTTLCAPSAPLQKRTNDCGSSSVNRGFVDWAPGADCRQIFNNIVGTGSWTINPNSERQLVSYGHCAFTVTNDNQSDYVYVGNDDIRDLINDSIAKYADGDGAVSAWGNMDCDSSLVNTMRHVKWKLHRI